MKFFLIHFLLFFIPSLFFSVKAQQIPIIGLVFWIPFNGNLKDESINRNKLNLIDNNKNGSIVSEIDNLSTDRFGNANRALILNERIGVNQGIKISLSDQLNLKDRTISLWIKSPYKLTKYYGNIFEIGSKQKASPYCSILGYEPNYISQKRVGKISCLIPEGKPTK